MDWVLAFEEFVDELVMANTLTKQYLTLPSFEILSDDCRRSDVLYAFGLDAGNIQYNSVTDSAILVTVNRHLTIIVSASPTGPAIYVDVPLENIIHTQIVSVWNDESQAHRYAVTIELSQIVGDNWHHNAVGQNSTTMAIAFTSQNHAEVLSELCRQSEKAWLTTPAPVMESQPINCSGTASHGRLARPNLASQRLAEVAFEAHLTLGQNSISGMLQDRHISQPGIVAGIHKDTQPVASSVASAIEGIDVSQRDTKSHRKTDSNSQIPIIHTDGSAIEVPRRVATSADIEFEESPRHRDKGNTQQDQGYDSSYDISPRSSRVQSKITDDAMPVIQVDPSNPRRSNRIVPATGDGSTEMPPSSEPSRSVRDKKPNVEAGVESPRLLRFQRGTSIFMEKTSKSRPMVNHGVTASANSKVEFQRSQLTKKAAKGKDEGHTPKGEDREHLEDEYDLPRSPEQQVRKASMIQDKSTSQAPDRETSLKQIIKAKDVAKNPLRHSKEAKSKTVEPQPKHNASRASGVHKSKAKPVADLTQPRSRRAAALIANKKIQGLEAFDEIGDDVEKSANISRRKPATTAETQDIHPSLTGIAEERVLRYTDAVQASLSGNAENGMVPVRDTAPSSRPDEDAIAEASSMEDVELVTNTTRHGIARAETTSEPSLPAPNPDLLVAQGISLYGAVENEVVGMNLTDDVHDRAPEVQNRENDFIPTSIIKDFDAVSEVEDPVIEPDLDMDEEVRPLGMVGDAEDSHFQEAMRGRGSIEQGEDGTITNKTQDPGNEEATRETEGHSYMAREKADDTYRATQPADQALTKSEKSKVNSVSSKGPDPFKAKLSLLTPDNGVTTSNAKESAQLHTEQNSKMSKEYVGDSRRGAQPGTQGDVWSVQRQKKRSLDGKSDLNKERRVRPQPQKDRRPMKQSVQAEQQRNDGHTQSQQAVSEQNGPRLPVPAIENKRKAVRDGGAMEKRPKLAPSKDQKAALQRISEGLQQAMGNTTSMSGHGKPMETSSAEVQVPDINRKPEIINFSAQGPMNQGSASIKKPKPKIVTSMEANDNIKAAPRNDRETLKRKPARPVDDSAPPAHEQPPKRHKPEITPPAKHTHIAQMLPEPNSIIVQDKPHRVSSQSTRVDQNGSPMPSMHALNERVAETHGYPKSEVPVDPSLCTEFHAEDEQDGFEILSSNRKRKCDSPTAPSSFTSIPAHYIFNDGTLVNVQTKENIVPKEPQDPFIGAGQARTSDFMLALRREGGTEARSQDALLSEKQLGINAKRGLPPSNEDPDKTLVEGQPPRKQRKHDIISISSTTTSTSSGSTSSGGLSPSMDPSEEGDANILAEWQRALQTHQRSMVSVLSDISQVSNANMPNV